MPGMPRPRSVKLLAYALIGLTAPSMCAACDTKAPSAAPASTHAPDVPATAASSVPSPSVSAGPTSAARAPGEREIAGAQQIVVAWKGAAQAPKTVTRSKADAKKRADEARAKLVHKAEPFERLVQEYSDDAPTRSANGATGNFERNAMPEAFSDATFALGVGEVSGVVETPSGYTIIKRTR